jgi:hypothetical protein
MALVSFEQEGFLMSFAFKEFKVFVVTFRIACEQGLVRISLMQSLEYLSLCELILL